MHRALFLIFFCEFSIGNAGNLDNNRETQIGNRNITDVEIQIKNNGNKKSKRCAEKISRENIQLNQIVGEAIGASRWRKEYALEANYTIAVQTKNSFTIYSGGIGKETNNDDIDEIVRIVNPNKSIEFCEEIRKNKDGQSLTLIFIKPEVDEWKVNGYQLIYPERGMGSQDNTLTRLANKLGKFLLIHSDSLGEDAILEIGRTVIHEGMHLFGQQQIIGAEPLSPDPSIRGRTYLQLNNPKYAELVQEEICLNAEMIERINENYEDIHQQAENDFKIIELLYKSIRVSEKRQEKFNTKPMESYWYLLEGLPQYLDQNYLKKRNPKKLVRIYKNLCSDPDAQSKTFYPNMTGAALFMGIEYVFEVIFQGDDSWKNALKLEYEQVQLWRSELIIRRLDDQRIKYTYDRSSAENIKEYK